MDPFTQRMLERAKIRREKLDNHFSKNLEPDHKNPLQQLQHQSNTTNEISPANALDKGKLGNNRKIKLQKLAQLYSGKDDALLSEESENENENKCKQSPKLSTNQNNKCKLNRLAELATRINQWEDDVNHSKHFKAVENNRVYEKNPSAMKENEKPKIWNPLADKLCAQGFTRSESQSKLSYEFKNLKGPERTEPPTRQVFASNVEGTPSSPPGKREDKIEFNGENPVSKKVAFFEMGKKDESKRDCRDPAELSIAERKALFEKKFDGTNKSSEWSFNRQQIESNSTSSHAYRNKISNVEKFINATEKKSSDTQRYLTNNTKFESFHSLASNAVTENVPAVVGSISSEQTANYKPDTSKDTEENIPKPPPMPLVASEKSNIAAKISECDLDENEKGISESPNGRLYPSLSNLDVSHVSEPPTETLEIDPANESKNSNICLNMSLTDLLEMNKNNPTTPPSDLSFSKSKEYQVLNKMDRFLDNALNDLSSECDEECMEDYPSPPKIMKSSSFEYKASASAGQPLLHTVSFYRKQQQNNLPNEEVEDQSDPVEDQTIFVENKIQDLLTEVNKQQTIISQASQALNLCLSTVEFSGSGEQVEGERLLLLASHKRQACLNEIQRLKVENSLRPQGEIFTSEKGDVTLSNISIRLKRDALRAMTAAENLYYFVCLIKSDERVLATPVVPATRENLTDLNLKFPGSIKLKSLLSNFRVTIEVYSLELSKELLPHEIKYHIANKKDKKLLTPIKSKKFDSKLVKPHIQSPAGPNAVRTSNFQMCGYIVFSLREINRRQWMLNKVPYVSALEGTLSMTIDSQLRLDDEFRGFLTMFDDISGFGAWHRRWCLLSSHIISFWKYPDDEQKKVPIGTIDLSSVVTENVSLVPHDICARLNTFLLETTRPKLLEDKNSLVLSVKDDVTTIRHLLSADSKQEMMIWCKKLNTILALLRSWKCNSDS